MTTIITNAKLYDGTGTAPFLADVTIEGERIAEIQPAGKSNTNTAKLVVDATGLVLTPGFIDAHDHSDTRIISNTNADSKIYQGITSIIAGNCGCSKCIEVMPNWDNVEDYARAVDNAQPAINIATLAGHNSIRERIMAYEDRQATQAELTAMYDILAKALEQGACGFSSGLWYLPGKYASTAEVVSLARALKNTGKPYATHMRSEGDGLLEALNEAMTVAAAGDNRLQVSHVKASPHHNWHKIDAVFNTIERARENGMKVFADRYPYIYSETSLRMILPPPWDRVSDVKNLLANPENAAAVVKRLNERLDVERDWKRVILMDFAKGFEQFAGCTLWEIAQQLGTTPGEATVAILSKCNPSAAYGKMSDDNMHRILAKPWVMPGTDASARRQDYTDGRSHPRAFGTIPEFFRIAKEAAPTEQVIHRMTQLPATVFNLKDRGIVKPGAFADLAIFDENAFRTQATYADPHQVPAGMHYVFVNGNLALDTQKRSQPGFFGRFLKVLNENRI